MSLCFAVFAALSAAAPDAHKALAGVTGCLKLSLPPPSVGRTTDSISSHFSEGARGDWVCG